MKIHAIKATESGTVYEYPDGSALTSCGRWIRTYEAAQTTKTITCHQCYHSKNTRTIDSRSSVLIRKSATIVNNES